MYQTTVGALCSLSGVHKVDFANRSAAENLFIADSANVWDLNVHLLQ